jgi:hypothetical protein
MPRLVTRRLQPAIRLFLSLAAAAGSLHAALPIADEALRLQALAAVFPGMAISASQRRIDLTYTLQARTRIRFPDALAPEAIYSVKGPPVDDRERCASEDMVRTRVTDVREVRFRIYPWPASNRDELLVIVQYRFMEAKPLASCPSIGALFRLAPAGANLEVKERYLLDTAHHDKIAGIAWFNLTGSGYEELVVESSAAGLDEFRSDLHIFNLTFGRFDELLSVPSRLYDSANADVWTQAVDVSGSLQRHGAEFCFAKTLFAREHRWFPSPEVSQVCYARGEGAGGAQGSHERE